MAARCGHNGVDEVPTPGVAQDEGGSPGPEGGEELSLVLGGQCHDRRARPTPNGLCVGASDRHVGQGQREDDHVGTGRPEATDRGVDPVGLADKFNRRFAIEDRAHPCAE